jgi:hypothetical protein
MFQGTEFQTDFSKRYDELILEGHSEESAFDLAEEYAQYMEDKRADRDEYYLDHPPLEPWWEQR